MLAGDDTASLDELWAPSRSYPARRETGTPQEPAERAAALESPTPDMCDRMPGAEMDRWLRAAHLARPTETPTLGRLVDSALLYGRLSDHVAPTATGPAEARGLQNAPELSPIERRARRHAAAWVFDLPVTKASEIAMAVDRLAGILVRFPDASNRDRIRALIDAGHSLDEITDAAELKGYFDGDGGLRRTRRYSEKRREWLISESGSGLAWRTAAKLIAVAPLEVLQDLLESDWMQEWLRIPLESTHVDDVLGQAFGSYATYVRKRDSARKRLKDMREAGRFDADESDDFGMDRLAVRARLRSGVAGADTSIDLVDVWISNGALA
jgi:hypothetical protein